MISQKEMIEFLKKELKKNAIITSFKKIIFITIEDFKGFDKNWKDVLIPVDEEKIITVENYLKELCEDFKEERCIYEFPTYSIMIKRESFDVSVPV